jgi:Xaa-Pro aminopeptidase
MIDASSDKPFTLFVLPGNQWLHCGMERGPELRELSKFSELMQHIMLVTSMKTDRDSFRKKSVSMHADDRMLRERIGPKGSSRPVFTDLAPVLHEMRVTKDDWEIARLKRAIDVTAMAQKRVLKTVAPGQKEYDVQAEIEYVFRKNGLPTGFSTITGSGPNAAILHYTR